MIHFVKNKSSKISKKNFLTLIPSLLAFSGSTLIVLTLASCSYNPLFDEEGWSKQDKAMGTVVQITLFTPPRSPQADTTSGASHKMPKNPTKTSPTKDIQTKAANALLDELMTDIQTYGTRFGKYSPEADIYKINQAPAGEPVKVDPLTLKLINRSLLYAKQTDGLFDPTVNPVVTLWSRAKKEGKLPPQEEIDQALKLVDYTQVEVGSSDSPTITLKTPGMGLDLGGVAKGYIADLLFEKLEANGISSAIINLGGNIHIKGTKQWGKKFTVGIQDPDKEVGSYVGVITIQDQAVVTSGDYQRFAIIEGKKYHHIIDPRTGYAGITNLRSATIISDSGSEADALATGVFLMGLEKGIEFIEDKPNLEAIFVTADKKVVVSSGLKENFKLTNIDYELSR